MATPWSNVALKATTNSFMNLTNQTTLMKIVMVGVPSDVIGASIQWTVHLRRHDRRSRCDFGNLRGDQSSLPRGRVTESDAVAGPRE